LNYCKFNYNISKTKYNFFIFDNYKKTKMKKQLFILIIMGFMTFISCKKEEEVKPVEEPQQKAQPFSGEAWLRQRVGNQAQTQQQPMQQTAQQSTSTPAQTSPGMNPPHGQPGHKCEIPVGEPLSSKPTANKQPQTITNVVNKKPENKPVMNVNSNNGSATIVGTTTLPGMNPPHGQEGHRCDVAVGAALPKE
jgi:hypothetical protein